MEFDREYRRLMLEFSEGAIRNIVKKFQNDATEQEIRREVADFEKYKNTLQKKDPFQYKSWMEFTEAIHAAKGKAEFKKKKVPTQEITANQDDIVADDENVTIYRGDSQDKCVLYGKGYTFCISRQAGGNMFSNYRLGKESTFYFIFFKKKPKSAKNHIMVLDHTNKGYEWTFADNDTQPVEGGWDEIVRKYPELGRYEKLLVNKKLDDEENFSLKTLKEFSNYQTSEQFNTFSYKQKAQALKSVINLSDEIWKTLDSTLRNEFLSIGPNLTPYQADDLKPNEIERYKKTREISFKQIPKRSIRFNKYDEVDIEYISTDVYLSYNYAKTLDNVDKIPNSIVTSISNDSDMSVRYAVNILKNKNVPDIIMDAIMGDVENLFDYSKILGRLPDYILHHKQFRPIYAKKYAIHILRHKNVPDVVLKKIASKGEYAYQYANSMNFENVPKIIIDGIKNDPLDFFKQPFHLPKNVTVQESTHFDKYYKKLMSSFF